MTARSPGFASRRRVDHRVVDLRPAGSTSMRRARTRAEIVMLDEHAFPASRCQEAGCAG